MIKQNIYWSDLFCQYVQHPETFWKNPFHRQIKKLNCRIEMIKKAYQLSIVDIISRVCSLVIFRTYKRGKTILIPNIGSSGSHWLQAMICEIDGFFGIGEVYIPPALIDELSLLNNENQRKIFDAINVLHTGTLSKSLITGSVINTAHSAKQDHWTNVDHSIFRILLVRNPIDICESRTFRKTEYRKYLHNSISDDEYLMENINKINTFFEKALNSKYDIMIRYEDLVNDSVMTMQKILLALENEVDNLLIQKIVEKFSKENIKDNANYTNLYKDKYNKVAKKHLKMMEFELKHISRALGYNTGF